eukprot:6491808-Amphidinium_carterae.4
MKPTRNNTTQSPTEFIKTFQNWRDEIFNYEQAVSEIGSTMKMTLLIQHIQGDIKNVYIDNSSGGGIQALGKPKKPWKPWKGKGNDDKNNKGKDWKGGKGKYDQQPYKPWQGKGKGGKNGGKPYYYQEGKAKGEGNYNYDYQSKGYYNYKKSKGKGKGDTPKGPPLPPG